MRDTNKAEINEIGGASKSINFQELYEALASFHYLHKTSILNELVWMFCASLVRNRSKFQHKHRIFKILSGQVNLHHYLIT